MRSINKSRQWSRSCSGCISTLLGDVVHILLMFSFRKHIPLWLEGRPGAWIYVTCHSPCSRTCWTTFCESNICRLFKRCGHGGANGELAFNGCVQQGRFMDRERTSEWETWYFIANVSGTMKSKYMWGCLMLMMNACILKKHTQVLYLRREWGHNYA